MKRHLITAATAALIAVFQVQLSASAINADSRITGVKLFTNMAEITRSARIKLTKGMNTVVLEGLPENLYDWSAKGSLPEKFRGRIMTLEISRQALLEKRRKKILNIEKILEELRERDVKLADELTNLKEQETFLDSISRFTQQTASKELATRMPRTAVWSDTNSYLSSSRKKILTSRRQIQKARKKLAKQIQKHEFELNQIAGNRYYSSYMQLNKAVQQNTISLDVQQYGNLTKQYAARENYLKADTSGLDTEKKIELSIYSESDTTADFTFSYIIPGTSWNMKYDFRADSGNRKIEVILYSDIRQKTGEDWNNIKLSLSTGAPLNNISLPGLHPWYLSKRPSYRRKYAGEYAKSAKADYLQEREEGVIKKKISKRALPSTTVTSRGINFEISFPLRQTIESSEKYQKKYLKTYTLRKRDDIKFFYKTIPSRSRKAYLMATAVNTTELPWLSGEAQVFLENEYIGKVTIPNTPKEKKQDLVLGIDPVISSKKELVKKYEDKSGVFGGNRQIIYSYNITVENDSAETKEVTVLDNFPVSRTDEIKVEIKNLSHKFKSDKDTLKSTEFARGIRTFILKVPGKSKQEITYDAVITFDKDININGLK